jgi:AhpD family alkylhydroperoxidase
MKKNYKSINLEQRQLASAYRQASPHAIEAFLGLHKSVMSEGMLSIKHKELIATGIAIAARCDGCIASHVGAALKAGASRQELIEAIDVAILMGGGPAYTYGAQALLAVDELACC